MRILACPWLYPSRVAIRLRASDAALREDPLVTLRMSGGFARCASLLLGFASSRAAAQEAVTVTGHVSTASMPVRGVAVRIESLNIGATTDGDGRYSFIVPSTRVRGQTVTIRASYPRFPPKSVNVRLVGGSIVQDFVLTPSSLDGAAGQPASAVRVASKTSARNLAFVLSPSSPVLDSTALIDLAGPVTLPLALTGQLAGLDVMTGATLGGSSAMLVRGAHSVLGLTQPLVVLNGTVLDNSSITGATQIAGRGGFDYGSAINDLNVADIATVKLLRGPVAAMQFGGRAANGVLMITTRSAYGLNGMTVSASQSLSDATVLRLPEYQNSYGQGLGGKFTFFDGRGGGVNDSTDQSWGPPLDGSPVTQASFAEAGRPDVRRWIPQPANVSGYFINGRTLETQLALQNGSEVGQLRASLSNGLTIGVTPRSTIAHRSALVTGVLQPNAHLSINGDIHLYSLSGANRPGTGFDESNPVSGFSHTPRQVDVSAYATHLRDSTLAQLSWNYSGRNNPYFGALANNNRDNRTRFVVGTAASYAFSEWLTASVRGSTDHTTEARFFTVAPGWIGGFPFFTGRGDFAAGGFQSDDIAVARADAEVMFRASPRLNGPVAFAFTAGTRMRSDELRMEVRGTDRTGDTTALRQTAWTGSSRATTMFSGAEWVIRDVAWLSATGQFESSSLMQGTSISTLYPAVNAGIDLAHVDWGFLRSHGPQALVVHGGWSRSGNDKTAALLQRLGVTAATSFATISEMNTPEVTTNMEVGASMRMLEDRVTMNTSLYSDRSENLHLALVGGMAGTGVLTNKGTEASLSLIPLRLKSGLEWAIGATFGKNTSQFDSRPNSQPVLLAIIPGGASIEARNGNPLGVIVGGAFLRNGAGRLVLRDGHPLVDSINGPRVLGETVPAWIGGLTTSLKLHGFDLSLHFDTHQGGRVFSASNREGALSGALAETGFRPDSGLLIEGIDDRTGAPNNVHISTESYYHSLARITERWVYDASFVKLRDARVSVSLPLTFISLLQVQSVRLSLIGRNLALWTHAPDIDPETLLSTANWRGTEIGQLPSTRSIGIQVSLTP